MRGCSVLGPRWRSDGRASESSSVHAAAVVGDGHCWFTAQHEGGTWGLQDDMCASEIISQARRARCCVCEWCGGIVGVDRSSTRRGSGFSAASARPRSCTCAGVSVRWAGIVEVKWVGCRSRQRGEIRRNSTARVSLRPTPATGGCRARAMVLRAWEMGPTGHAPFFTSLRHVEEGLLEWTSTEPKGV